MSNTMRWRYGDTNPVTLPVLSAEVIEIGDIICMDSGNAESAVSQPDTGDPGDNLNEVHLKFVGVAMQSSPDGSTEQIRIATSGVFEFDCPSATFNLGDLISGGPNATSTGILNQTVTSTAIESEAIGRCAKRVNPAGTKVLVDIVSTVMRGGPQTVA